MGKTPLLSDRRIRTIVGRVRDDKRVRRTLPVWGRVHIDRQLPFLCVYRKPANATAPGVERLITSQAAYVLADAAPALHQRLCVLLKGILGVMSQSFGTCAVIEICEGKGMCSNDPETRPRPFFQLLHSPASAAEMSCELFREQLQKVACSRQQAVSRSESSPQVAPEGLRPLLTQKDLRELSCHLLCIEVSPIYRAPETGLVYPIVLRQLRRQFKRAMDHGFFQFARKFTTHRPAHYHSLGRRAAVQAVWTADRRLAEIADSYDVLYQVTPINLGKAWHTFTRRRSDRNPEFFYRPLPFDPSRCKHLLHKIDMERIEDPTLMHLFLDKQTEMDRQLTLLSDIGHPRFLYDSLALYGAPPESLVNTAQRIIERVSCCRTGSKGDKRVGAEVIAAEARAEIAYYRTRGDHFNASVDVQDEMFTGLMVSQGRLLVGSQASLTRARLAACIHHEVGTHLLTYYNGKTQPFRMLHTGLPGYEGLQEGLAILAEYLSGGLNASRLLTLASRVIAINAMISGADFVEVYRLLQDGPSCSPRNDFSIAARAFRGGGFAKDVIYLRGFIEILELLAAGVDLNTLLIGKIAAEHTAIVEELAYRKILVGAPLQPRYLTMDGTQERLARVKAGISIDDLTTEVATRDGRRR